MIVALVIPALDEEDAIGPLLASIDRTLVRDIIVGDNGSRDATAAIAARAGATVVRVDERGYGAACAGALTPQQRFGNWLATRLISVLYQHRYTDLGPFRAIRRELLDRIAMQDRRYGWTVEMQVRALQLGARVSEVGVKYRRRVGRSKISGTVTGIIKAGWWIVYTIFKYARR